MIEIIPAPSQRLTMAALEIGAARFAIFDRLVDEGEPVSSPTIAAISAAIGLKERAVRTLVTRFQKDRSPSALAPKNRGPKPGSFRCGEIVQSAILTLAQEVLLVVHPPSIAEAAREIRALLHHPERGHGFAETDIPDERTIIRILGRISARTVARKSLGSKSRTAHEPHPGIHLSGGVLDVVQMDHTSANVILVDRIHRLELGRPVLTLVIDIFTRSILGWYVSFGDPSIYRCGRAIVNAMLPKAPLLARLGLDIQYPMYGSFAKLHADQAAPHRNDGFRRACLDNAIDPDIRKPGPAHHGGHIERLIGTMLGKMRLLPGATGANVTLRDGYDAGAEAAMTLPEFERWLLIQIAIYHLTPHNGLDQRTPAHAWAEAVTGKTPLLRIGTDPDHLVKQFLPSQELLVRPTGVQRNHRRYWSPVLAPYLGQKVLVHRDESSIARMYAEIGGEFHALSPMGHAYPDVSEAEWEAARQRHRQESSNHRGDQFTEIANYRHMARLEMETAKTLTKAVRAQRKRAEVEGSSHGDQPNEMATAFAGPAWVPVAALSPDDWTPSYYDC